MNKRTKIDYLIETHHLSDVLGRCFEEGHISEKEFKDGYSVLWEMEHIIEDLWHVSLQAHNIKKHISFSPLMDCILQIGNWKYFLDDDKEE